MLKKAGIAAAIAAAGLLALSPIALADTDQDNTQNFKQGEGKWNGESIANNQTELTCSEILTDVMGGMPGMADCTSSSTDAPQNVEQRKSND